MVTFLIAFALVYAILRPGYLLLALLLIAAMAS